MTGKNCGGTVIKYLGNGIAGIAFDLEGTMVDLEPLHKKAHKSVAMSLGIAPTVFENLPKALSYFPHFIGGPDEEVAKEMLAYINYQGDGQASYTQKLVEQKRQLFRKFRDELQNIEPRQGLTDFIEKLLHRGVTLSVGSVTPDEDALLLLEKANLLRYFSRRNCILRSNVAHPKPDPEVYIKTAKAMGIDPKMQLVFEDSATGVQSAKSAGSFVIGIPAVMNPFLNSKLEEFGALRVFTTWDDINKIVPD